MLETPLRFAIENGDLAVAEVLIKAGANVDARDHIGQTPLHIAQSAEAVDILVEANASIEAKDNLGRTPLHYLKIPEAVKALIDRRANVHIKDNKGRTPIQITEERANSYHRPIKTIAYITDTKILDILKGTSHLTIKCHDFLLRSVVKLNALEF